MKEVQNAMPIGAAGPLEAMCRPERAAGRQQRSHVAPSLQAVWAKNLDDVRAAQRLRHQVFVEEMGAQPAPLPGGNTQRSG